jgi:thiol:disulfide interchange protein
MQENDVIAIIIILLFAFLAGIAFGIYRLVHIARTRGTVTTTSSSGSTDEELADD